MLKGTTDREYTTILCEDSVLTENPNLDQEWVE